jgi:predicted GH43/DUF377 family glycosyl hydrolase
MAKAHMMTHSHLHLRPDPSRTVIRPFMPEDPPAFAVEGHPRAQRIAERVLGLDEAGLREEFAHIMPSLASRHRDVEALLLRRFGEVSGLLADSRSIGRERKLLIGAYFCEEYSFEAAALFNPSMVLHPDQSNLPPNRIRFLLSLRGIGEGHVSSVTFRTGSWGLEAGFLVDPPSGFAVPPRIEQPVDGDGEGAVRLRCEGSRDVSETVLFPVTSSQRQGIEDVRLVRFTEDDGGINYLGTYTAFDGRTARSELLYCSDFRTFLMRPLIGAAAGSKGMALFPRKIDGRFVMLGRQDNENIWLLDSDDIHRWEGGRKLVTPRWPWEFVQMGNCGSPIEIEEGWLVLTHGVGMARNYCMGACLLDKKDPSRILARTAMPLLHPSAKERDGYVPNVVYSCGGLVHDRTLLVPYGVADNFATFASVPLEKLLAMMI